MNEIHVSRSKKLSAYICMQLFINKLYIATQSMTKYKHVPGTYVPYSHTPHKCNYACTYIRAQSKDQKLVGYSLKVETLLDNHWLQ